MKSRPRNAANKSFQQQNGGPPAGPGVGGFMRKTLSVPNISQLFGGPSPSSNNLVGNSKMPQLNGSSNSNSPAGQGNTSLLLGENNIANGHLNGMRRTRPIRSESLANLSGFSSPSGATISPSQQSPQTPRPSSLSLGNSFRFLPINCI